MVAPVRLIRTAQHLRPQRINCFKGDLILRAGCSVGNLQSCEIEEPFESLIVGPEAIEILTARGGVSGHNITCVAAKQKSGDRSCYDAARRQLSCRVNPSRDYIRPLHGLARQAAGICEEDTSIDTGRSLRQSLFAGKR